MVRVGRPPRDRPARGFTLAATLARVGLHKPLVMAAMKSALPPSMPQAARSVLIRDLTSPRNQRAAGREAQEIGDVGRREMENHSGSRFVIASQSSHPIPSQQPELVAAEITRVVEMVR
jgi:hypothetical protein